MKSIRLSLVIGVLLSLPHTAAIAAEDDKMAGYFESSFAHEASGNYERALNATMQVLRGQPNHYIGNLRAGWLYYLKNKHDDALVYYKKAAVLSNQSIEAQLGLMLPLMATKRWKEAEKVAQAILHRAPNNYLAGSRLAFIYFSQGKYKPSELQYKKVLAEFPSQLEMLLGLGWTYLRQGKKSQARTMFQRVLGIRRHNLNARAGLDALSAN